MRLLEFVGIIESKPVKGIEIEVKAGIEHLKAKDYQEVRKLLPILTKMDIMKLNEVVGNSFYNRILYGLPGTGSLTQRQSMQLITAYCLIKKRISLN